MADLSKYYPTSNALGGSSSFQNGAGRIFERFRMCFKDGFTCSYPYQYVGLIEIKGQEHIVMHCLCGTVHSISIWGVNLGSLARKLCDRSIEEVEESAHPEYAKPDETIVETIEVVQAEEKE